jgi:ethanolamine ammonia-lyase small subunit
MEVSFHPASTSARVAQGDGIAAALGARLVVVLAGERPSMGSTDSLGIYLTHEPGVAGPGTPGPRDSERNCISNVRRPNGVVHLAAADTSRY